MYIVPRRLPTWTRPIPKGTLPVYDEALKLIKKDSSMLKSKLRALRADISAAEKDGKDVEVMKKQAEKLEIESRVNLPSVRWRVSTGLVDMSLPVHRHLLEQKWRKEGPLDLLMERIHQMHVVPDLLPDLHPSVDLHVQFLKKPEFLYSNTRRRHAQVEPGVYLLPEQTRHPPRLYATVFHTETRLYTLLMVDPDVPDEANSTFQSYLHWLQPNIPLSALTSGEILNLNTHTPYIPPHPQKGTPYHRYTLLLLPQHSSISIPVVPDEGRIGFDVRAFAREVGLDLENGGGAHMWREVWNAEVSKIYSDVLKMEEPKYGRPPKLDPYQEIKQKPRYIK